MEDAISKYQILSVSDKDKQKPSDAMAALGLVLWGAGLVGAHNATKQMPTYRDISDKNSESIEGIIRDFDASVLGIETSTMASVNERINDVTGQIASDLRARGITDSRQAQASQNMFKSQMSGAYAAANDALRRAKLNATMTTDKALATYYTGLADKQIASEIQKQRAKMGIYAALAGSGGALIAADPAYSKLRRERAATKLSDEQRAKDEAYEQSLTDMGKDSSEWSDTQASSAA